MPYGSLTIQAEAQAELRLQWGRDGSREGGSWAPDTLDLARLLGLPQLLGSSILGKAGPPPEQVGSSAAGRGVRVHGVTVPKPSRCHELSLLTKYLWSFFAE